jgi:Fe-S cluster assembly protein SufD
MAIVNGRAGVAETLPQGAIVSVAPGSALDAGEDVLGRLNRALAPETFVLHLTPELDRPVHLDRRIEGEAAHSASSARIAVADDANVTVVETYSGSAAPHVGNHATHVSVGRNATLTHVTVNLMGAAATHFATAEYELAEGARVRTLTVNAGAALSRSRIVGRFAGSGAQADFTGLNLVGEGQHSDITLEVNHDVPGTGSKPLYKQVARGRSKAVFQGRIVVARDAQKTDAKMNMQGLMLSEDAEILSKPELEIYADDVVCGHGSTCGALDETAMFYLMSRGIPKGEAETMLVRAFLASVIDPIEPEAVREALTTVVEGWLAG